MAYTFNTGNPVGANGSTDARDLVDNAQVEDLLINSTELTAPDRLGVQRRTWAGINHSVAGYTPRGPWVTGTDYLVNELWEYDGSWYLVLSDYTSGATAEDDIAGGNVVVHQPKDWVVSVDTIADLRNFEPAFSGQQVELLGHTVAGVGGGMWYHDASDTTSADDNGVTVVTTGGKRWKRRDGWAFFLRPEWFGAIGDGASHKLSEFYSTLADAQLHYPFVTSIDVEIDWAAAQACLLRAGETHVENSALIIDRPLSMNESDTGLCVISGASISAAPDFSGSAMVSVGSLINRAENVKIFGNGTLLAGVNCDLVAEVIYARRSDIMNINIRGGVLGGIKIGDLSADGPSYEINIDNASIVATGGVNSDPSSAGVHLTTMSSDCTIGGGTTVTGYRKGFFSEGASHRFTDAHAWSIQGFGPMTHCYHITGGQNMLIECYADTPHSKNVDGSIDASITDVYGFLLEGFNPVLVATKIFLNGTDGWAVTDIAHGIRLGRTGGIYGTVVAPSFLNGGSVKFKTLFSWADDQARKTTDVFGVIDAGSGSYLTRGIEMGSEVANFTAKTDIAITGTSAVSRALFWRTDGVNRWRAAAGSGTESGGNAGSNWTLTRYNDDGSFADIPVQIERTNGRIVLGAGSSITSVRINTVSETVVGSAGAAASLPAAPVGYIKININGTDRKIPYYNT